MGIPLGFSARLSGRNLSKEHNDRGVEAMGAGDLSIRIDGLAVSLIQG